jgi:hypothetical protein
MWGLNLELNACKVGALPLHSVCSVYFGDGGLVNYAQATLSIIISIIDSKLERITGISQWHLTHYLNFVC